MQSTTQPQAQTPNHNEATVLAELFDKPVRVYLGNKSVTLRGDLVGYDNNTLVLEDGDGRTLVYKAYVASVYEDKDAYEEVGQ